MNWCRSQSANKRLHRNAETVKIEDIWKLVLSYQAAVTAVMFRATMGMAISPIVGKVATLGVTVGASYYVGAVIGSSAVALGRTLSCGTSIADALAMARENQIYASWLEAELLKHPEFLRSAA